MARKRNTRKKTTGKMKKMTATKNRTRTVPKSGKGTGGRGGSPQVRAPRVPKGKGKPTRKVPKSGKGTGGKGGSPQVKAQGTRGGSPQVKAQGYKGGSPQRKAQGTRGGSPQSARGQGSKGGYPRSKPQGTKGGSPQVIAQGTKGGSPQVKAPNKSRNVAHGGVYRGGGPRIHDVAKFKKGIAKAAAQKVKEKTKGRSTYRRG